MPPPGIEIRTAGGESCLAEQLADLLIDCVAGGASVSFMWPLRRDTALAYWNGVIDSAVRDERALLIAWDTSAGVCGTVQLILNMPENQPHRGEIAKMLVHRRVRRCGVGASLLTAAETAARAAGRTLLVLDTASSDAARLYARLGWQRCGAIPGYALWPQGGRCATTIFYKELT